MQYEEFCKVFRAGSLTSTKVEVSEDKIRRGHAKLLALIAEGRISRKAQMEGYAFRCGYNGSVDATRAATHRMREEIARAGRREQVSLREKQMRDFLAAVALVEETLSPHAHGVRAGCKAMKQMIGGATVEQICLEQNITANNLYKRLERVRKAVVLSGIVTVREVSELFTDGGKFRPVASVQNTTRRLAART